MIVPNNDITFSFTGKERDSETGFGYFGARYYASSLPVQHLQYLPFGEPFVNEQIATYSERFTFTGKERDAETGYYYDGARFDKPKELIRYKKTRLSSRVFLYCLRDSNPRSSD